MFSSDTKINRNFKNGPLKRHQDSYHRNESNKMNKNYHNKNSYGPFLFFKTLFLCY